MIRNLHSFPAPAPRWPNSMRWARVCVTNARAISRALEIAKQPTRSRGARGGIGQGTHPATHPRPARTHDADAVYLLPRRSPQHGRGPGPDARNRAARAGLRRLPPAQLRRVRHTGETGHFRHQRPGRNPARPLGMGREAPGRQLCPRLSKQRFQRKLCAGRSRGVRSIVSRAHGGV